MTARWPRGHSAARRLPSSCNVSFDNPLGLRDIAFRRALQFANDSPCQRQCGNNADSEQSPSDSTPLIPLALRGVKFVAESASAVLRRNLLIYGVGGIVAPFIGIKLIDLVVHTLLGA